MVALDSHKSISFVTEGPLRLMGGWMRCESYQKNYSGSHGRGLGSRVTQHKRSTSTHSPEKHRSLKAPKRSTYEKKYGTILWWLCPLGTYPHDHILPPLILANADGTHEIIS